MVINPKSALLNGLTKLRAATTLHLNNVKIWEALRAWYLQYLTISVSKFKVVLGKKVWGSLFYTLSSSTLTSCASITVYTDQLLNTLKNINTLISHNQLCYKHNFHEYMNYSLKSFSGWPGQQEIICIPHDNCSYWGLKKKEKKLLL